VKRAERREVPASCYILSYGDAYDTH